MGWDCICYTKFAQSLLVSRKHAVSYSQVTSINQSISHLLAVITRDKTETYKLTISCTSRQKRCPRNTMQQAAIALTKTQYCIQWTLEFGELNWSLSGRYFPYTSVLRGQTRGGGAHATPPRFVGRPRREQHSYSSIHIGLHSSLSLSCRLSGPSPVVSFINEIVGQLV